MPRLLLLLAPLFLFAPVAAAEDWPEFRGPTGQGHYAGKLPTEWSPTKNVAWKTAIPGAGWSSPVVRAGRVYLTTAVPVDGSKDLSLRAVCLDAATGKIVWQTEAFRQDGAKAPRIHSKNSHASPTPVIDEHRLYVHFGHQGTAAVDLAGTVIWKNVELKYAPVHGNGGSPIPVGDTLVFAADGSDAQFVAALDRATGKVAWKVDRRSEAGRRFSFATPLRVEADGKAHLVSPASDVMTAHDPTDGKELWRVRYDGYSVIPRPVAGHGLVFLSTGYDRAKLLAVRPGGKIEWTLTKAAPNTPSPLLVGDELYTVSDQGIASCVDARTGKVVWQERVGGNYSASPLHAAGLIYLQSEEGVTTVLKAGRTFAKVATNTLDERTFASYAAADGALYLRTEGHLYRIAER